MNAIVHKYIDKIDNFEQLPFTDQVKYLAYCFLKTKEENFFTPKNITNIFRRAHLKEPSNINDLFKKLSDREQPIFLKRGKNYIFQRTVFKKMEEEFSTSKSKQKISLSLRKLITKINSKEEANFLEEAINCYEIKSYRASILMTWLLVMSHLQNHILTKKISDFNSSLRLQNLRINTITKIDDFSELKETKFIEICRSASIISKDIRKILDEKLGIRNTCAHPNDIKISESKATSFIEDLVENVLLKLT